MGIIGSFLFLILFVLLFVVVLGLNILARIFGGVRNLWDFLTGNRSNSYQQGGRGFSSNAHSSGSNAGGNKSSASTNQSNRPHSKGVFADDEGTYVDFEEIVEK